MRKTVQSATLAAALLATFAVSPDPAAAATIILDPPVADGHVNGFGAGNIVDTTSFVMLTQFGPGGFERRAAFEFDLAPLVGVSIQSATLTIQVGANLGIKELDGYSGDGAIALADFLVPANVVATIPDGGGSLAFHDLDVTSFVQSLLGSSAQYAGFMVRTLPGTAPPGSVPQAQISATEINDSRRPRIVIVTATVPEPATIALLGLGLAGFAARRRATRGG